MNSYAAVTTSSGRQLRLGSILGKGGEGTIFHVEGDSKIAAKVYTDGKAPARRPKVRAMIADRLNERTPFVAFPIEMIAIDGSFVGFTMQKVSRAKLMHQLCAPGDRKTNFPDANFQFLLRTALNFARAVASINALGAVIGDINESGALVDQSGMVTLIDSDSFQYRRADGQVFRCRVGKGEYTPPELQSQLLGNADRTINHDAFGVAVIIFELLFMGRHPFAGIYRGLGEQPTIAKAIQEGRFADSPHRSQTQMEPPPYVPVLADIPREVAEAFQSAFGTPSCRVKRRPSAAEWIPLLQSMEIGLIECRENSGHYYSRVAHACPWCRYEAATGSVLFVAHQPIARSGVDLREIMATIESIQNPGQAPELMSLMPALGNLWPSQGARRFKRLVLARKAAGFGIAALAILLSVNQMGWGLFLLIPAGILFFGTAAGAAAIVEQRARVEQQWREAVASWNQEAGSERFDKRKGAVLQTVSSYRALPDVEREMLQGLDKQRRDLQIRKHLEAHKLSTASIEGIADGRKIRAIRF